MMNLAAPTHPPARRRNLDLTHLTPTAKKPKPHQRSVRQRMSQRHPPRSPRLKTPLSKMPVSRTCSLVT
jgi:hypothetical protein